MSPDDQRQKPQRGVAGRKRTRAIGDDARETRQGDGTEKGKKLRSVSPRTPRLDLADLGARDMAPRPRGAGVANTIIYVHGVGNKPKASILKCQWDTALFGAPLGDRSRMVYWVNRGYYPTPLETICSSPDTVRIDDDEASTRAILAVGRGESLSDEQVVERELRALADGEPEAERVLRSIAGHIEARGESWAEHGEAGNSALGVSAKVLPLPRFLRRSFARRLTRAFLRDVHDFLFDETRRAAMEASLIERMTAGGGPFVIVAHSQGSMIAYEVLRRLDPDRFKVPLFVTIGSPLGIGEVQDELRDWAGGALRTPDCVEAWLNIADDFDAIAADRRLDNDFGGLGVKDVTVENPDRVGDPHSATGYLSTSEVRSAVRGTVGAAFQQAIAPFAIAKNLVADIEDGDADVRHPTLIQLADEGSAVGASPASLTTTADGVERTIRALLEDRRGRTDDVQLEKLRHFVSARLTRREIEVLRSQFKELKISGIWRNARKRALIHESTHTVQARPANTGYEADGRDICWAVLDTGIRANHSHFAKHRNVVAQWDCTESGPARQMSHGHVHFADLDQHGHGTHVAGIIAGEADMADVRYAGMAPRTKLFGFKVLDDAGDGDDAWIIKALDEVMRLNEDAGRLVVHGVNLSLGGAFDPSVYGCGHTPLCQELRRLWRQGVLVCLAAGNEGYAVLNTTAGELQANLDLSIGDPANLEETIAVGSVHKTRPHTYGVSFFSSRGPTADGRRKPDVVAPGERIVSARHDWQSALDEDRYVEMSGTSMAAPHVSGVLAAFLSRKREFIGEPDRVKAMLLASCVDLRRDPNMQGAGLPNLIKMLALA